MENTETTTRKGGMNPIVIAVIVLLILGGAYAIFSRSQTSTPGTNTQVTPATGTNTTTETSLPADDGNGSGTNTQGAVKEFTLEAGSFYYTPNTITVNEGDTVRVTITSKDMMHDFTLDEFNVKSATAKAGESTTIDFVASKKGSFEFYCSVGQHRQNGQVGTLIVQ